MDHLTHDSKFELFSNFDYFGGLKNTKEAIPVVGPVEEIIVDHSKLKIVFMNVNSLVSPLKRSKAKLGIEKSKKNTEFKVRGYYTATNLPRKPGAGGLAWW